MLSFATVEEWKQAFGTSYDDSVFELVDTHRLFQIKEDKVYFRLSLRELFDEAIDLFSVDPDLVDEMVQLSLVFGDTEINPDVLTNLLDFSEDKLGYSVVDNAGGFSLRISDVRKYYGETEFDMEMEKLFPGHSKWW
jgi:hypothetical protein